MKLGAYQDEEFHKIIIWIPTKVLLPANVREIGIRKEREREKKIGIYVQKVAFIMNW